MVGAHRASISRLVTSWCRKALVILPVPLKRSRSRRRGVIAAFFYSAATIHVVGRNDWARCRLAECGCLREEGTHVFAIPGDFLLEDGTPLIAEFHDQVRVAKDMGPLMGISKSFKFQRDSLSAARVEPAACATSHPF
jgi:hypothetical protein